MKKYIKIFFITLSIQIVGYLLSVLLNEVTVGSNLKSDITILPVILGVVVALVVDIILAIRWGNSIKAKLVYIFLMPTNYFWLVFLLWAISHVKQWADILLNIYS